MVLSFFPLTGKHIPKPGFFQWDNELRISSIESVIQSATGHCPGLAAKGDPEHSVDRTGCDPYIVIGRMKMVCYPKRDQDGGEAEPIGNEEIMFQVATYENYPDGAVIFKDGSHGDWIYIVEEGEVEISKQIGERKIVIAVMKPGELFGELSYIGKMARTATAIAIGPTVVGVLDRNYLDQEFNKMPADFQYMLTKMALNLKITTERLLAVTLEQKS
jgi:hypothetical protein